MKVICSTLLIEKSPQALPLGAACIASAIKHNPLTKDLCSVDLLVFSMEDPDFIRSGDSVEERAGFIVSRILKEKPQIVALSMFVWNRIILEQVGTVLQNAGVVCIAGGPEVTAHPQEIKGFDFLVCGEGEGTVPSVVHKIITEKIKPGYNHQVISSEICNDLSYSPYLDGTLNPSEYEGALWELARGCPFKCSYCYESKGQKIVRQLPESRIEAELDLFAKKKIPQVFVLDPTYNSNKKKAIDLLKLIAKKTPNTFYYFEARAEFIDRELAHAFTKIPCALQIGLQSADENVLRLVNRNFNKKQFARNIGFLNEEGVIFGFDLIYGLPGETLNGFMSGIDFAMSLYPNNLELFCLSVLPGTDLYDRAQELHLTYECYPPYHVKYTDKFSESDMLKAGAISNACNYFYNQGRSVPWFLSICKLFRMRPSNFLELFADFKREKHIKDSCRHKEIQENQLKFVSYLMQQKNLRKFENLVYDIICFNGSLARVQETGSPEELQLHYDSEYLASQYASDIIFFEKNIKPYASRVKVFKNGKYADWKKI